jgi:hypothetical protein
MLMATPIKKRRQLVDPTGDQLPLDVKTEGLRCCQLTQAVHDFVDGNSRGELHRAVYFLQSHRIPSLPWMVGHCALSANVFMEVISPINIGCPKLYYE